MLAGAVGDKRQGVSNALVDQRPFVSCPALKISNFDSERCWITWALTCSTGNLFGGALESALLIAMVFGDGCLTFMVAKVFLIWIAVNRIV